MIYGCVLELSEPPGVRNKLGGHRVFYTLSRGDNLCVWWGLGISASRSSTSCPEMRFCVNKESMISPPVFLSPNFSPAAFFPNWTSQASTDWWRYEWFISRHWERAESWRERGNWFLFEYFLISLEFSRPPPRSERLSTAATTAEQHHSAQWLRWWCCPLAVDCCWSPLFVVPSYHLTALTFSAPSHSRVIAALKQLCGWSRGLGLIESNGTRDL